MASTMQMRTEEGARLSHPMSRGIYSLIDKTMNEHPMHERIRAVIALGDSEDPRAVRPLIDCCRDRNYEIRLHAIVALGNLRSGRSVEVLIERLQDITELEENREQACIALGSIGSLSAIDGLKEIFRLESTDPSLKSCIAGILGPSLVQ